MKSTLTCSILLVTLLPAALCTHLKMLEPLSPRPVSWNWPPFNGRSEMSEVDKNDQTNRSAEWNMPFWIGMFSLFTLAVILLGCWWCLKKKKSKPTPVLYESYPYPICTIPCPPPPYTFQADAAATNRSVSPYMPTTVPNGPTPSSAPQDYPPSYNS